MELVVLRDGDLDRESMLGLFEEHVWKARTVERLRPKSVMSVMNLHNQCQPRTARLWFSEFRTPYSVLHLKSAPLLRGDLCGYFVFLHRGMLPVSDMACDAARGPSSPRLFRRHDYEYLYGARSSSTGPIWVSPEGFHGSSRGGGCMSGA
jgi:hypothetical protein